MQVLCESIFMKTSTLIRHLQRLLEKEGDLDVGIHTPDYGSYACSIGNVKAGVDGTIDDDDFGVVSPKGWMAKERMIVIRGKY